MMNMNEKKGNTMDKFLEIESDPTNAGVLYYHHLLL